MESITLHFDNARTVQQIFNNNPRNMQALEERLKVKATSRDGWIKLEGETGPVERAKKMIESLESGLRTGARVSDREFNHALSTVETDGPEVLKNLMSDRIQTSTKKPFINPKTAGQKAYIEAIRKSDITLGIGPAGTGKTYLAMAMAVSALKDKTVDRIILTRPAVEAGEALGFLPGELEQKIAPYLRPLQDALHDMIPAEEIQKHYDRNTVEIAPLAYMRGRTLNNAFIILDESQNSTREQMFMFLTRLGYNSKAVITGDPTQVDLPMHKQSGLVEALTALKNVPGIAISQFEKKDVVRNPLVQRVIEAYEKHRDGE